MWMELHSPKLAADVRSRCHPDMEVVNYLVQTMRNNPAMYGMEQHLEKSAILHGTRPSAEVERNLA